MHSAMTATLKSEQEVISREARQAQERLKVVDAGLEQWQRILRKARAFVTECAVAYRKANAHCGDCRPTHITPVRRDHPNPGAVMSYNTVYVDGQVGATETWDRSLLVWPYMKDPYLG
jgi:hypothetical protein